MNTNIEYTDTDADDAETDTEEKKNKNEWWSRALSAGGEWIFFNSHILSLK